MKTCFTDPQHGLDPETYIKLYELFSSKPYYSLPHHHHLQQKTKSFGIQNVGAIACNDYTLRCFSCAKIFFKKLFVMDAV